MTRLTIVQRNQALGMLICGTSNRQVAEFFEFKRSQLLNYGTDTSRGCQKLIFEKQSSNLILQNINQLTAIN